MTNVSQEVSGRASPGCGPFPPHRGVFSLAFDFPQSPGHIPPLPGRVQSQTVLLLSKSPKRMPCNRALLGSGLWVHQPSSAKGPGFRAAGQARCRAFAIINLWPVTLDWWSVTPGAKATPQQPSINHQLSRLGPHGPGSGCSAGPAAGRGSLCGARRTRKRLATCLDFPDCLMSGCHLKSSLKHCFWVDVK